MQTRLVPPRLGQHVLVVVDNTPAFIDALRAAAASLPDITPRFFTLLHCCPTIYWEYGGGAAEAVRQDVERVWEAEETELQRTEDYFARARSVLERAGVPAAHIVTRTVTEENSLVAAAMAELRAGRYSGVIVGIEHQEIINRLLKRGVTDVFRRIPSVAVWVIDEVLVAEPVM